MHSNLGSFHYWLSDLYHVPKHLLCLYLMRLLFIDPFIGISGLIVVLQANCSVRGQLFKISFQPTLPNQLVQGARC